jgi:glycerol 2-dehydrogenase (NADP+)
VNPARIDENRKLISLDDEDMKTLATLPEKNGGVKRFVYPPFGVNAGFPDKPEGMDLSG